MKNTIGLVVLLNFIVINVFAGDILINEVSATSFRNYFDEDYEDSDWIELFNNSQKPVNLGGYKIYDKDKLQSAWEFPDTIIHPKEFLVVFASDKNRKGSEKIEIKSYGKGIVPYHLEDEFRFHYVKLSGNFEISVRINSFFSKQFWSKSGIMLRENLAPASRFSGIFCTPNERKIISILQRDTVNTYPQRYYFNQPDFPYNWIKIQREGDSTFYFTKNDGYNWKRIWQLHSDIKNDLYVGIASASADANSYDNVRVLLSELEINGENFNFEELLVTEIGHHLTGSSALSRELHSNFKLGAGGETIYLWDNKGNKIDEFKFPAQSTNITYGRYPDGENNLCFLKEITPNSPNQECFGGKSEQPVVSHQSGFYNGKIRVGITSPNVNDKIYFTLNGAEPTIHSTLYDGTDIPIEKNTVLKARIISPNKMNNFSVTRNYFIDEPFVLPTIAVATDSLDLWHHDYGLFLDKNIFSEREIPVYFDFWENSDKPAFSSGAGAKLHGGATQYEVPQKSLRFHSRNLYGNDEFKNKFWDNQINKNVDKFIIKNGGQDWYGTFLRDAYSSCFIKEFPNVLIMESRPVEAYINGEYYGAYILKDRFDEDFIGLKYDVEPSSVNYIEDETELKQGSSVKFFEHLKFINTLELKIDSVFKKVEERIDLNNFIEYTIFRFYSGVWDWPGQNHKIWNSEEYDQKWRWVLHDFDLSFGSSDAVPEKNMFVQVRNTKSYYTDLFFKLLENTNFRNNFINKFADYLNSSLLPEPTISKLDSLAEIFAPAVARHQLRWSRSIHNWDSAVATFREYLTKRPDNIFKHIVDEFSLEGTEQITVESNYEDGCDFKINSLVISGDSWTGKYFKGVPVTITCIPREGYKFVKWSGDSTFYHSEIEINPENDPKFQALLIKEDEINNNIVINEIMYKAADTKDCKDWIEILNHGSEDTDISGWQLKDNDDGHIFEFQNGTVIKSGGFLVVVEDSVKFRSFYPDSVKITGQFDFGYGRGDDVRLYDKSGKLVDSVSYDVTSPWDKNADGTGYSLELINPDFDNSLAQSWIASSTEGGTPGRHNDKYLGIEDNQQVNEIVISPNPAKDFITISLQPSQGSLLEIYDMLGVKVISEPIHPMTSSHRMNIENLPEGVYLIKIGDRVEKFVKW